ncbi:hypothetical protein Tco_0306395, partial [Tanacetum coccineum]
PYRKRCRSPATTVPSFIPALGALVHTRADLLPPRKRFKDSYSLHDTVKEDIDADMLADIEADATAVEVAEDMDVEAGVDASIDGMLMLDAEKRLDQVKKVVQDIYGHVIKIPLQRLEDIKSG